MTLVIAHMESITFSENERGVPEVILHYICIKHYNYLMLSSVHMAAG